MQLTNILLGFLVTVASATPLAEPQSHSRRELKEIIPIKSKYTPSTGSIEFSTSSGEISKKGGNGGVTALLTFLIPEEAVGKKVSFQFHTDDMTQAKGSGLVHVYTTYGLPTEPSEPGIPRNQHIGSLHIRAGDDEDASYVDGPHIAQSFTAAEAVYLELICAEEDDYIFWYDTLGPYLSYEK